MHIHAVTSVFEMHSQSHCIHNSKDSKKHNLGCHIYMYTREKYNRVVLHCVFLNIQVRTVPIIKLHYCIVSQIYHLDL